MGEKVGFTNCIFESCALLKTLFLVISANSAVAMKNRYVEKQKIMKIVGCF